MFQVTKEWLDTFCTERGGYTMAQVRCLGYPNGFKTKSWKRKSVGIWITEENKQRFEEFSSRKVTKGESRKLKQEKINSDKAAYIACEGVKPFRSAMTTDFIKSEEFLKTFDWLQLRMRALTKLGSRCSCCGATPNNDGVKICVDHVKPRKFYPQLALDINNLQILCEDCNFGKGNGFPVDWSKRI